jgi:hypothetical protein
MVAIIEFVRLGQKRMCAVADIRAIAKWPINGPFPANLPSSFSVA